MTAIYWFKRDLRLADNPALSEAAARGPVVPVYIVEPGYWALPDTSERHYLFLRDTVADLAAALRAAGSGLVVRVGAAEAVLAALARETGARALWSGEETGNGWTYARDRRVAGWARGAGLPWHERPQCGVQRRLRDRDGWARGRDRFVFGGIVPEPVFSPLDLPGSAPMPAPEALGLAPDGCHDRQPGGRAAALTCLGGFLTERGRTYRAGMAGPETGARVCSRLSPHLSLGAISVREAAQATAARQRAVRGTRDGWIGSLKSFQARLAWRDHFTQKLEDEPDIERACMHPAYEGLRPAVPDPERLAAWARGETGVPFVDACMRSLIATGWLNFRMRAMLVSFASYHLWLDWRATGPHLARMFTDYEPGIHWPQMQMQAGTTGINTVRIYNPVKQGGDQDAAGRFTRAWLPELAPVPDAFLHAPWRWEGAGRVLGRSYPHPIVDLAEAGRAARERVWAVRRGGAFRAEAARVVRRHASRKDGTGRFVDDRAARRRPPAPDQLSLDL